MSVNVSKFAKKKENSSSVTVNNSSRGYSNTNNNYTASQLDRMLWNIHDTGQDINEPLTLPALSVNGTITAGGRITGRGGLTIFGDSYMNGDVRITGDLNVEDNKIKAHEIEAVIGNITYLNSDRITTKYLDVTKSAHFAELVIDKIKSVGGSAVFSPADGFKLNTEDDIIRIYTQNKTATNYWMLCWEGEDDRGATVNMWEIGDQALCQNFNEAVIGTSYNVSNTYYWMLVRGKGTYDPNANTPEKIQYDRGSSAADTSNYMTDAYDSEGNLITFKTPKHYIIVYNYPALYTDAENKTYVQMTGDFNPKPGQDIVMLGHRAQTDELEIEENQKYPNFKKRQSAIYIAAYNSTIEPDLMAPLIAQYEGINDFDLSSHRTTHFAAGHNKIFGYDNVIKGSFKTINGTDITDLNGVTYFIKTDKAYVPVTSDYSLDSSFNINIDCMYISGDSGPLYVGNRNSNMRLIVRYSRGNTNKSNTVYDTKIKSTYTLNLGQIIAPSTVLSGKIDSLSFEIAEYVNETVGYNTLYQYNMPVIQLPDNISYTNTELYKLNPMIELAQVDVEGNFALYLQYQVQYIIGNTVTNVDNTDYSVQFVIWDEDNNREHTKTIPYNSNKGCFEYNKSTQNNYEKTNVFGTYGGRSLLHDQYIEVSLIKNNGSVMVDKRIIPITLVAGAMFSVTDSITARVTSSESTLTDHTNRIGQLELDSTHFSTDIAAINTVLNSYGGDIESLESNYSYIHQYADSISTRVENTRTEFNNAYSYITSNYSTIDQTAEQISLYVNSYGVSQDQLMRTGIDIEIGKITLNGNTTVNGQLELNSSEGFNLNNEDGSLGAKIHGGEIPNYGDWKSLTSTEIEKNNEIWKSFTTLDVSQNFTLDFGQARFELGRHNSGDKFIFDQIGLRTSVILTDCTVTAKLYRGTTQVKTFNKTLTESTSYFWNIDFSETYDITTTDDYYISLTFSCTGTPRFENCSFTGIIHLDTPITALIEIGSNGIATRGDENNYNYISNDITEFRHNTGGISINNNSISTGAGTLYYTADKTSASTTNPVYSWRSFTSVPCTMVTSNYYCVNSDCILIVNTSNNITLTLPDDPYDGQIINIRRTYNGNIISINSNNKNFYYLGGNSGVVTNYNLFSSGGYFAKLIYEPHLLGWMILEIS